MRVLLLSLSLLFGLCGCASVDVHTYGTIVVPFKWSPTASDVALCERAIGRKLWRATEGRRELSSYCVRLYAVVREERQVFVGCALDAHEAGSNGLLMPERPESIQNPTSDAPLYLIWGKGEEWFQFQFDRQAKKLTKFEIRAHPSPI
jgi:hypothetical protein